jgi:multiple sugar transport system substrate-binding protein
MTNRRKFLNQASAGAAAVGAAADVARPGRRQQWNNQPEKGAKLRVLRWKRFVQGDEDAYIANVKKFSDKYGIEVRVDNEGWEDVRPRPRWPPTPAPARTSSCPPTTTPTCTRTSWST